MKRSLLLSLLAGAAMACATSSSQSGAPPSSQGEGEIVCRYEYPTGSHMRKRICRTRAAMAEEERQAQDFLRRGTMGPTAR